MLSMSLVHWAPRRSLGRLRASQSCPSWGRRRVDGSGPPKEPGAEPPVPQALAPAGEKKRGALRAGEKAVGKRNSRRGGRARPRMDDLGSTRNNDSRKMGSQKLRVAGAPTHITNLENSLNRVQCSGLASPWAGPIGGHGFSPRAPARIFATETEPTRASAPGHARRWAQRAREGRDGHRDPGPNTRAGFNPGLFAHRSTLDVLGEPASDHCPCIPPERAASSRVLVGDRHRAQCRFPWALVLLGATLGTWGPCGWFPKFHRGFLGRDPGVMKIKSCPRDWGDAI